MKLKDDQNFDLRGKEYFSTEEAAHYCCVSLRQFKRHREDYELFPIRFMGKTLFRREDCKHAIESQRIKVQAVTPHHSYDPEQDERTFQ